MVVMAEGSCSVFVATPDVGSPGGLYELWIGTIACSSAPSLEALTAAVQDMPMRTGMFVVARRQKSGPAVSAAAVRDVDPVALTALYEQAPIDPELADELDTIDAFADRQTFRATDPGRWISDTETALEYVNIAAVAGVRRSLLRRAAYAVVKTVRSTSAWHKQAMPVARGLIFSTATRQELLDAAAKLVGHPSEFKVDVPLGMLLRLCLAAADRGSVNFEEAHVVEQVMHIRRGKGRPGWGHRKSNAAWQNLQKSLLDQIRVEASTEEIMLAIAAEAWRHAP